MNVIRLPQRIMDQGLSPQLDPLGFRFRPIISLLSFQRHFLFYKYNLIANWYTQLKFLEDLFLHFTIYLNVAKLELHKNQIPILNANKCIDTFNSWWDYDNIGVKNNFCALIKIYLIRYNLFHKHFVISGMSHQPFPV